MPPYKQKGGYAARLGDKMMVNVYVKPNAKSFKIELKNDKWIIHVPKKPEKGKVNAYLKNKLYKKFKCNVRIIKGFKSRNKIIEIECINNQKELMNKFK